MIICKNKRKGILSPYSRLRTAFGRQRPPHFSSGKHSHQPHLTSFSRAHLETDNWSAEFYILFIFFLSNQTKWFPFKKATLKPERRAALLSCSSSNVVFERPSRRNACSWPPVAGVRTLEPYLTKREPRPRTDGQRQNSLSSVRTQKVKSNNISQGDISTVKRWMIWCFKFPGFPKMSNIDSSVTQSLRKL